MKDNGEGDTAQERRGPNKSCLFTHRVIRSPWKGLFFFLTCLLKWGI